MTAGESQGGSEATPGDDVDNHTTVYWVVLGTWVVYGILISILWWMREESAKRKIFVRCKEGDEAGRYQLSLRVGQVTHDYAWRANRIVVTLYGRIGLDPPVGDVSSDEQVTQKTQTTVRGGHTIGGPQQHSFPDINKDPDIYTLTKFDIPPEMIFSVPYTYTKHERELRLIDIVIHTARELAPLYAIAINHSGRVGGIQIHSVHFRDLSNPAAYLLKIYMGRAGYISHVPVVEKERKQFFIRPIYGMSVSSGIGKSFDARQQFQEPHPRPPLNFTWIEAFLSHAVSMTGVQVILRHAPGWFELAERFDYNYILAAGLVAGILGLLIMFLALGLLAAFKVARDNSSLYWYHAFNVVCHALTFGYGFTAVGFSIYLWLDAGNISQGIQGNWGMSFLIASLLMVIVTFLLLMYAGMRDWMSDWTPASDRALHPPSRYIDATHHPA